MLAGATGKGFFGARRRGTGAGGWPVVAFMVAALVCVPVLVIVGTVFVPTGEIWAHLASTVLATYVTNSIWLLLGVAVGTLVIGVGTAWLITMYRFPGRGVFEWALLLPFAVPAYVLAYTYTGLLDFAGPVQTGLREAFGWSSRADYWFPHIRSLGGAIWMMTFVLYPYVYLLARAAFLEQSVCVLEVSRTLGCTRWQCFRQVALPLARPGIVAGLTFALIETLADYGTVQFFAVDTFTTGIFRTWIGLGQPMAAAQLGAILMIFVFILVLGERASRGRGRVHHTSTRYRGLPEFQLRGMKALGAQAACFAPVFIGFLLPGVALASWSVETWDKMVDAGFLRYALNSFTLAATTAAIAVAVALVMAYGLRLAPTRAMRAASRIAAMGYAVPGAVIGVGVLIAYTAFDRFVDQWMTSLFGISTGLLLTGTLGGIVFAYLVRFLAVSFNTTEAGLAKITPSMDAAARTLGRRPGEVLVQVHAPLMWGSVLTAAMLVFVDVMKELPATLLLRPFNFDTLAIRAYQLASDERLADSSSAALAIVLVGMLPVMMLSFAIARSRAGHADDTGPDWGAADAAR